MQAVETLRDAVGGLEEVTGELELDAAAAYYRESTALWLADPIRTPDE